MSTLTSLLPVGLVVVGVYAIVRFVVLRAEVHHARARLRHLVSGHCEHHPEVVGVLETLGGGGGGVIL